MEMGEDGSAPVTGVRGCNRRWYPTDPAERFLGEAGFFNRDCEKTPGKYLEARDYCALDLFAPKLIQVR
jgi:hypothetical protein